MYHSLDVLQRDLVPSGWSAALGTPAPIVVEREKSAPDTDGATQQTVDRMAKYIRESGADPLVIANAQRALERFGGGRLDPAAKCWAVFWFVKHAVKFKLDEKTMWELGEFNQQDLLISPAVLVRMRRPAEDCDGFTMIVAALLKALGVDVVIATVAVDPRDPERWSHVFPCALLPGGVVEPLDASHGSAPGWMVPLDRVSRFQAWDLEGRAVDVRPQRYQGLHNYVRTKGLGDCPSGQVEQAIGDDMGSVCVPGAAAPQTSAGWTQFFQSLAQQGVSIAKSILTPPTYQQTTRDAAGNLVSTTVRNATPSTALTAGAGAISSSSLLWIGGGVLGLVLLMQMGKNR